MEKAVSAVRRVAHYFITSRLRYATMAQVYCVSVAAKGLIRYAIPLKKIYASKFNCTAYREENEMIRRNRAPLTFCTLQA